MVNQAIKPIETVYNGYRFRSRLEARWAVFFDALGVKWEYEKEGYDLREAGWYLPDFWLPQVEMWAEVKATEFTQEQSEKCRQLARQTGHSCFELVGIPHPKPYYAWGWEGENFTSDIVPGYIFMDYAISNSRGYLDTEHRFYASGVYDEDFFPPYNCYPDTVAAAEAARQARFGQNGRG